MTQNIYDSGAFFAEYSKYPRAIHGIEGASEWPMLQKMLPESLNGKAVLDLGCGEGWFARWAAGQGAAEVMGVDVSANMLARAQRDLNDNEKQVVSFGRTDLNTMSLDKNTYDLVFSGLALHYADALEHPFQQVFTSLKPGGVFVFSVEHPIFTAPRVPGFVNSASCSIVASDTESDEDVPAQPVWPLESYFAEGLRTVNWLGAGVKKQHRMVSSYFKNLLVAGFQIEAVNEWGGTNDKGRLHPNWPNEGVIPRFLLIAASRPEKMRSP